MNDLNELADYFRGSAILWGITILIFAIFVIILAKRISDSIKVAADNNGRINQYLAAVPADQIGTVNAVYQSSHKDLGIALILAIVGGTFGFHQIYLGKRRPATFMFLFFWTGIPTVLSLFQLSVLPKTVSEFNLSIARSLYEQIAAPKIKS